MRVTITIRVNNCELDTVRCFQHLGQPKTQDLSYNTCVNCNLKKARARWAHFSKVLQQEGATASIIGMFYKAAVKSVLLYGCETWALTERILQHNTTQHNTTQQRRKNTRVIINRVIPSLYAAFHVYPASKQCPTNKRRMAIKQKTATRPRSNSAQEHQHHTRTS